MSPGSPLCQTVMLAALVLLAACSEDRERPRPRQVVPSSVSNRQETPIKILGESFRVLVHANFDDPLKSRVDDRFKVRLDSVELEGVRYVSPTNLEATVQAGLPPGLYDLEVEDPWKQSGVLPGALSVLGGADAATDAPTGDGGPGDAPTGDAGGGGVQQLLSDPFGDGTSFSFVFKYNGLIYLGPDKTGTGAVRVNPDGTGATTISFSFAADTSGNSSHNKATPPYSSIGHAGCTADTQQCGPDNEDGRGIFAAGAIGGSEWLVMAGARTAGDLDYVYMTPDTGTKLDLRYVDLSPWMGPQTRGSSALHVLSDRVYLGFPDTGGKRPYLVVVKVTPLAPGLDADTTAEAENLGANAMPRLGGSAAMSMIDAMIDFNNRLYLFNNGGCMRATVAQPASYETNKSDWADCTPSDARYSGKTAVTTSKVEGIEPADKAFPQLAVYKGRLYAGRNTSAGPQLWACDPTTSGDTGQCEPDDWALAVGNSQGDAALSQLNNAGNVRITLVAATSARLYIGFDNAQGVVLFQTSAAAPAVAADFSGDGGCSASAHPAGCAGLGGYGLGTASNTRVLDAVSASFAGTSYLYLTAGSGSGPVSLYRIAD